MSLKLGTTDISGVPTTLIDTVNNKLDASTYTSNPRTNAIYITETYHSGYSWYCVYSDGWCEQGGYVASTTTDNSNVDITLLKPFADSNYTITLGNYALSTVSQSSYVHHFGVITSYNQSHIFIILRSKTYQTGCYWRAEGYIS